MSKDEYKDDIKEEKAGGSSRLGKEAKIGVTVIGLLLIVFGVVVVVRLRAATSDDKPAVAAEREGGRERAGHESRTESLFKEKRSKPFGGGVSPKAVTVNPAPVTPLKTSPDGLDRWKLPADRDKTRRSDGGPPLNAPPQFTSDSPKPPQPDQHKRHASEPSARKDRETAPAASRSVAMEPAPSLPPDSERSRYGHLAAPPAPFPSETPKWAGEGRSTPAMIVAQYDAGDYRREPPEPRRPGAGSHHSAATLYNPRAVRRDDGKYEVQPNDSYWTISERLYGTGAYFKALAQQNRGRGAGEDRLQPGELIMAPTVAELEKSYPDLCPKPSRRDALQSQSQSRVSTVSARNQFRGGRTYTVAEGDTLFNIARYELGKASRWAEIYDLNRDVLGKDFNYLTPGIQLILPETEKSDVTAQPPGNLYRR